MNEPNTSITNITKFQRYYCTIIDNILSLAILLIIVNFINIFAKFPEEFIIAILTYLIILTLINHYYINSMSLIFKHHIVDKNNIKINFYILFARNLVKLLLIIIFFLTFPISFIVFPFHTNWNEKKETVIDKIFNTHAVKIINP